MIEPIIDNREQREGKPGLHALIVGVSAYTHLPDEDDRKGSPVLGMRQLSSSALAAYEIYQWLSQWQARLEVPLATCRLLLSPSPAELQARPELQGLAERATLNNFQAAVQEWRADALSSKKNMTLLYFAGHGVQRIRGDHVLLLEEFDDTKNPLLQYAITTTALMDGMAPVDGQADIARTQLYFIDACRIKPEVFAKYEDLQTAPLWDIQKSNIDDRVVATFYTSIPGREAYGIKGQQTLFSKALIDCLSGGAGDENNCIDEEGQPQWCITINSINSALEHFMRQVNQEIGTLHTQMFRSSGLGPNVVIHRLNNPPEVEVQLFVVPSAALECADIEILDDSDAHALDLTKPVCPHPFKTRLPAGTYRVAAKIDPPQETYKDYKPRHIYIRPPQARWVIKVD
ncbi:MAG: caspase family protein [Blastocatellia bacterium]